MHCPLNMKQLVEQSRGEEWTSFYNFLFENFQWNFLRRF